MPEPIDTRLNRLRQRAERALASGRRGGEVLGVLETMTREAPDGSQYALFAHRHLAEIQLEGSPWRAALHLRRVIDAGAGDDSVHALMGLCQALLGNYRAAVAEYRKAVKLSPRNPWYHHNLGHLLDVGLGDSSCALDHLRIAHRLQSGEDEITASLAHCLARLGQLDEARVMAEHAVESAPRNREHRTLLDWVLQGAPSSETPPQRGGRGKTKFSLDSQGPHAAHTPGEDDSNESLDARQKSDHAAQEAHGAQEAHDAYEQTDEVPHDARSAAPVRAAADGPQRAASPELTQRSEQVPRLLEARMPQAGFSEEHVARARSLWADFCAERPPRMSKPAVYAAAVEYTIAKLDCIGHVTQAELARRYGVAPRSISTRYDEIRSSLALDIPHDPRYAR